MAADFGHRHRPSGANRGHRLEGAAKACLDGTSFPEVRARMEPRAFEVIENHTALQPDVRHRGRGDTHFQFQVPGSQKMRSSPPRTGSRNALAAANTSESVLHGRSSSAAITA
jgi:hypothetical protein